VAPTPAQKSSVHLLGKRSNTYTGLTLARIEQGKMVGYHTRLDREELKKQVSDV
jgi:hypothetical protein